jgi:hypothetical protein
MRSVAGWQRFRRAGRPSNKELKLTSVEHIGRSQLNSSVGHTERTKDREGEGSGQEQLVRLRIGAATDQVAPGGGGRCRNPACHAACIRRSGVAPRLRERGGDDLARFALAVLILVEWRA